MITGGQWPDRALSRRGFLKLAGGTLALGALSPAIHIGEALGAAGKRSRVVVLRDDAIFAEGGGMDGNAARKLVDRAVCLVTRKKHAGAAWKSLFGPSDVVGIKVNCLAGRMLSTSPVLCLAVMEGLKSAGVPEKNVIIWDQISANLRAAGYTISARGGEGVRCYGNDMGGYEREPKIVGSIGSCFALTLSRRCTAIVNMPVLKDHDLAGVTLSLKNFFGAIHNPNKYHDNNCDPYIADLNTHEYITKKQRLIVMDATTGVYHGGPSYKKKYAWRFAGVIVGTDPVAVDAVGAKIVESKRADNGLPSLEEAGRAPSYIESAAERGVGTADLGSIDIVEE